MTDFDPGWAADELRRVRAEVATWPEWMRQAAGIRPEVTGRDAETLVAWVREAADELESAHHALDTRGVPRCLPGREPVECTLAARIVLLIDGPPRRL